MCLKHALGLRSGQLLLLHGPLTYCSDVAEAVVKSFKWKSALTNYTRTQNGEMTSPFRKLIQRMPGT